MPVSSTPVVSDTPGEILARSAGAPMYCGRNILEVYNQQAQWKTSRSWAGTDITYASRPPRYLYDRMAKLRSEPVGQGGTITAYYLVFDLTPGTGDANEIDFYAIFNHNFHRLAATVSVLIRVADNSAFTTNLTTVASWTGPFTAAPLVVSNAVFRYFNVQYLCVDITTTAGGTGFNSGSQDLYPRIGEIICGRRRQMSFPPDVPWNWKDYGSDVSVAEFRGGDRNVYKDAVGFRTLPAALYRSGGVDRFTLNQESTIRALWEDSAFGSKPIVVHPRPVDDPTDVVLMDWTDLSPRLAVQSLGPSEILATLPAMVELPPFTATLT